MAKKFVRSTHHVVPCLVASGNLQTALDLKVDRVGHALELIKDEELMAKSVSFDDHALSAVGVLNGFPGGSAVHPRDRPRCLLFVYKLGWLAMRLCHRYIEAGIHIEVRWLGLCSQCRLRNCCFACSGCCA